MAGHVWVTLPAGAGRACEDCGANANDDTLTAQCPVATEEEADFRRGHSHPSFPGAEWTPCSKLTHCPSICDCRVECTAEVVA